MDRDIALLMEKAKAGDGQSILDLAEAYMIGIKVEQDEDKAVKMLTALANDDKADKLCVMKAMLELAHWYRHDCQPKDCKTAALWYQKLADLGSTKASNDLGWLYYNGEHGIKKDRKKATEYFQKALDGGNVDGYFGLGWCCYFDDRQKSFNFWLEGANKGQADCFNNVGVEYLNGGEVQQDYKQAFEWFKKGAEAQRPKACFNLARMYQCGQHVKQDLTTATQYFVDSLRYGYKQKYDTVYEIKQNAKAGDFLACVTLADIYAYGRYGFEKDYETAYRYLGDAKQLLTTKKKNDISAMF